MISILKSRQDNKSIVIDHSVDYRSKIALVWRKIYSWILANKFLLSVYFAARIFLLLLAVVNAVAQHSYLARELSNWDGVWYIRLATRGYPKHPLRYQTTLGFFPLYSMVMWLIARVLAGNLLWAGLVINFIGGLISTILLEKLLSNWGMEAVSKRAIILYCFFPGAVIFSMVYSEGILIPLVMGCLLLIEQRRYILAGILGFFATATAPIALAIVLVLFVVFIRELKSDSHSVRKAKEAFWAILISLGGIGCFGIFLWIWTGTPLASYYAQRYGWKESTTPLALYDQAKILASEISFHRFNYHNINLNYIVALFGAVYLLVFLYYLLKPKLVIPVSAFAWTVGVGILALISARTPPTPRILIIAFPVVVVAAYRFSERAFRIYLLLSVIILTLMSSLTFVGIALRP